MKRLYHPVLSRLLTTGFCAGALLSASPAHAAEEKPKTGPKGPPTLTADERKNVEDQYLLPSPGDGLDALDHAAKIDWAALAVGLGQGAEKAYPIDSDKALNLGVAVADAFVATKAKSKEQIKQTSAMVARLGLELSDDKSLEERRDRVRKLVDEGKWTELGDLLEKVRLDVLNELRVADDQDSVTLANVGGWLRGLNLASNALAKSYSAEGAKVLRQPGLIAYLETRVAKLDVTATQSKAVGAVKAKLGEIKALCTFAPEAKATLPEEKVKQLQQLTDELIKTIRG